MENTLLIKLRDGKELSLREQILLIIQLSIPAIMAQVSATVVSFIDASMVGSLGANASASIGLVSSTTWVFGGIISAVSTGFTVQVARYIGAKDEKSARLVVKEGLLIGLIFAACLVCLGLIASQIMPTWLGGSEEIKGDATIYLMVYAICIPIVQMNTMAGGMLQCAGNIRLPSILNTLMCILDACFNFFFIFPTRSWHGILIPGAGLGVLGAALGTACAELVVASLMLYALLFQSPMLRIWGRKSFHGPEVFYFNIRHLKAAVQVGLPVAIEQLIMGSSYIIVTKIVAPLGTISIAANSFGITAEGLCYMPGFGIGVAAMTIVGQTIGAGRKELAHKLGWLATLIGMGVMAVMGVLMYILAPVEMRLLSPDAEIIALGVQILRIEAFAEPFYGASIVAANVLRSAGDSLTSSAMNLLSIWLVRLPLSFLLAANMGLRGVWTGMCIELIVRGILFLFRLTRKNWIKKL